MKYTIEIESEESRDTIYRSLLIFANPSIIAINGVPVPKTLQQPMYGPCRICGNPLWEDQQITNCGSSEDPDKAHVKCVAE